MPRFSIVVPAYNAQSTLGETLDAVLAQTLADWECIIVDDGSTDSTRDIANAYAARDTRFRVLHQENQGSAGAYNAGGAAARGDFIVLCSADDILLPSHHSKMSALIAANPGYGIYSSSGFFWQPDGSRVPVHNVEELERMESQSLPDVIRFCFYSVGAAYRREYFRMVGGYRLGIFGEDYDFWLRAMAWGARHKFTPKALSLHRVSPTQKSADVEKAYRSDIGIVSDLRRDFDLSEDALAAVDECIRDRESKIAALHAPPSPAALEPPLNTREKTAGLAARLLGEERAYRLRKWLNRILGRRGGA